MRAVKWLAFPIGLLALVIALMVATDTTYLWRAAKGTWLMGNDTANINDHVAFPTRVIAAAPPKPWPQRESLKPLPDQLRNYLQANDAVAFLVAHRGQLIAEEYFQGYTDRSRTNSFSMAKTVTTLLLAIAIDEGYISGVDQPLTELLPEFSDQAFATQATIGSLATMSSGYEWDENYYNAFSPMVRLLYCEDVGAYALQGEFTREPESYFYYSSASTQLLGLSISRALQAADSALTLSGYLSDKLWQPMGMNDDALWHLDGVGLELAYCCLNTNARNFAKLGQLMLQDGRWDGAQLVNADAIEAMRTPVADDEYGYGTWINNANDPQFYAFRGHLGQYILVVPEHELIVVRLGESRGLDQSQASMQKTLPYYISQAMTLIDEPATNESPQP